MNRYIGKCLLSFGVLLFIAFVSCVIEGQVVPISYSEILTALKAALPAGTTKNQLIKFLIADVKKRKVDERLVGQQEDKLQQAGATEALIAAIRENLVLPEIQSNFFIPRFAEGSQIVITDPDGVQRPGLLLDKFESVTDGDLSARVDSLYTQLNNDPAATAAVITFGADNEINRRFAKIRNTIDLRKYSPSRIRFLRGEERSTILTKIFIFPGTSEKESPDPVPTLEPKSTESEELRILSKPKASYTENARKDGINGTVVLDVTFLDSGLLGPIEVVSGLSEGLTDKAIEAAKQIKFIPAKIAGKPVSVTKRVEYNFSLY